MEKIRSFISIDIPEMPAVADIRERLRSIRGISVPGSVHLTLRFLGDVDANKIKELSERMRSLEEHRSFNVSVEGLGAFPNAREPRVVWIGADLGDPFRSILSDLDRMLDSLVIDYDRRPFKAHVTVGRVNRRSEPITDILNRSKDMYAGSFRCTEIRLMKSVLTPEGAKHSAVGTFRLVDG